MIIQERLEEGSDLIKSYSNLGFMIEQVGTGIRYAEAVDPEYMNRQYTETDESVEPDMND